MILHCRRLLCGNGCIEEGAVGSRRLRRGQRIEKPRIARGGRGEGLRENQIGACWRLLLRQLVREQVLKVVLISQPKIGFGGLYKWIGFLYLGRSRIMECWIQFQILVDLSILLLSNCVCLLVCHGSWLLSEWRFLVTCLSLQLICHQWVFHSLIYPQCWSCLNLLYSQSFFNQLREVAFFLLVWVGFEIQKTLNQMSKSHILCLSLLQ